MPRARDAQARQAASRSHRAFADAGSSEARDPRSASVVVALGLAMLLGGGGTPHPLGELVLQSLWAPLMLFWVWRFSAPTESCPALRPALAVAMLLLLVPALQLVPLPPAIWQALPGRALERSALQLAGADSAWMPLTLTPDRTFAALLALALPASLLVMVAGLDHRWRNRLLAVIAVMAALGLAAGAAMRGSDASTIIVYAKASTELLGFQANRNSEADVLLIAIVAFAAWLREWQKAHPRRIDGWAGLGVLTLGCLVFGIGVLLSGSRTGIALLPLALGAAAIIHRPRRGPGLRTLAIGGAGLAALALAGWLILRHNAIVAGIIGRLNFASEMRGEFWRDTLVAIQTYSPWGTGIGSFVPIYMQTERLETIGPAIVNRAHNDYLEWALEAGIPGVLACLAILAVLLLAMLRSIRQTPRGSRTHIFAGAAILTFVALHSLVDYPLRSISLACIAAVGAALLLPCRNFGGDNGVDSLKVRR